MKRVLGVMVLVSMIVGSCQKDSIVPMYAREKPHATLELGPIIRPIFPDTFRVPDRPRLPIVKEPLVLSRCIDSFEDFIQVFGRDQIFAKAVILENGVEVTLGGNLAAIWYKAVPELRGSSLFRSQLQVEWRPDPSAYWNAFTAEVWTLGCVYSNSVAGPFTNILKGGTEILINTCFFWGAPPYEHVRIKYLVTD